MSNTVWTFTNKKELDKSQFINYVERKVFRTIRKHQMLPKSRGDIGILGSAPKNKIITLKKSQDINTLVLKKIIETKFEVKFLPSSEGTCRSATKPNISAINSSQLAEDIFKEILDGNFKKQIPANAPLSQLSDKEVELYAKLSNIKGTRRKQDKKIQTLFDKFLKKNQDLELNIVKALKQING